MRSPSPPRYQGVFPVAPTIFHADGSLDLEGQKRCIDFMIDAGSNGICILANFSEQFSLSDDERELIRLGGDAIEGPWDGEEAITLLADLDAGATGAMTGGAFPDGIRPIVEAHHAGQHDEAFRLYQRWLPLINHENRQGGILTAKALMAEGGVIACEAGRHPFPPMHPEVRKGLVDIARRLDPLVLRWNT